MIIVSNTTPLIGLAILRRIELLRVLFSEVYLPRGVHEEIAVKGIGRVGSREIAEAVAAGWGHVEEAANGATLATLKIDLDEGEAEAIALALTRNADLLLMDERKGRAKAKALGLHVVGTIGVLLIASAQGIVIDLAADLKSLRSNGFRISDGLLERILMVVGAVWAWRSSPAN